jgi:hypothetical protein
VEVDTATLSLSEKRNGNRRRFGEKPKLTRLNRAAKPGIDKPLDQWLHEGHATPKDAREHEGTQLVSAENMPMTLCAWTQKRNRSLLKRRLGKNITIQSFHPEEQGETLYFF